MSEFQARMSNDRQAASAKGRRFPDEFKRDAVRLVLEEEHTFKAAAKAAGVVRDPVSGSPQGRGLDAIRPLCHCLAAFSTDRM